ncbi:hypothetical protein [Arthrobacter sp. B0490]|uniref:hypothetical protein n=1 Tax=Arthrobacter sp. B0490 TaxID=2058891 RepID=UPI0011B0D858|nr:hypothetical protein [Arthrobacter sp. B0490]
MSKAEDDTPPRVEMPTRRQLRLQQVEGRAVAPVPGSGEGAAAGSGRTPDASMDAGPGPATDAATATAARTPVPGGRRDRRRRQGAAVAVAPADGPVGVPADGRLLGDMSVEEALAARNAIAAEAREHLAVLETAGDDPFRVDPEVLAQQKVLAERAATLNSRARRLPDDPGQDRSRLAVPADPTAAHNLSIITPIEFVDVPDGTPAVLRAPATTSVPVVLPRATTPAAGVEDPEHGATAPAPQGHPRMGGTEPVRARNAFGLEPLDAMTAGLGRLRRVRYLQYSLVGVGAAALATGIVLTVSSLNG